MRKIGNFVLWTVLHLGLRPRRRPRSRPGRARLRHRSGPHRWQHHRRHRPQSRSRGCDVRELHPRHGADRVDRHLRPRDRVPAAGQDLSQPNQIRVRSVRRPLRAAVCVSAPGAASRRRDRAPDGSSPEGLTPCKSLCRTRAPARRPGSRPPPVPLKGYGGCASRHVPLPDRASRMPRVCVASPASRRLTKRGVTRSWAAPSERPRVRPCTLAP